MEGHNLFEDVYAARRGVPSHVLEEVVTLAIEIAREGREGRRIGTIFVIADSAAVLQQSKPLIFDPLQGHPDALKRLDNPNMRETVKELAQLDGAFVVSETGVFLSACRYIDASSKDIDLPLGFGSRHMAAASITKRTRAVAVVVSESGLVRIFDDGELVSEILPEVWLLRRFSSQIEGPRSEYTTEDVAVFNRMES